MSTWQQQDIQAASLEVGKVLPALAALQGQGLARRPRQLRGLAAMRDGLAALPVYRRGPAATILASLAADLAYLSTEIAAWAPDDDRDEPMS